MMKDLGPELKILVHHAVALLGQVLQRELGPKVFARIENLRKEMAALRNQSSRRVFLSLQDHIKYFRKLSKQERLELARAFTLMLELMNACENAYRSYRLKSKPEKDFKKTPESIVYVLTSHPTEARAPESIAIFHEIQCVLGEMIENLNPFVESDLRNLLEVAWKIAIVRKRTPTVRDEADHIYSMLFRESVFYSLLELREKRVPFFIHTWVGGDKDGHPGVQEKTLLESLTLSRRYLIHFSLRQLRDLRKILALFDSGNLRREVFILEVQLAKLHQLKTGDGDRLRKLRKQILRLQECYRKEFSGIHPALRRLEGILHLFPGLVVPLELRESSDVLMSTPKPGTRLVIEKMLAALARISRGGDPRWYARGFIISMTASIEHIREAAKIQMKIFGRIPLPVIPLFEEASALKNSSQIVRQMTQDVKIRRAADELWDKKLQVMVGYSDSSKEAGVLASRLAIAEALPQLERVCQRAHLTAVFFHGSGGSTDRGGGAIQDQMAWWPKSALRNYKVTVQGEMVERSLANKEITQGQILHIIESAAFGLSRMNHVQKNRVLEKFALQVAAFYHQQTRSQEFLEMVEKATPYSYLSLLKLGSRPAKRTHQLTVSGLRAIPWILCWTQTRVLFPTWWGVGSAWAQATAAEKESLRRSFKKDAVFNIYVKALGYTLAKTELAVWRLYLEQSRLSAAQVHASYSTFEKEWKKSALFFKQLTGKKDFTWEKPWLGDSICLRAPMIHPLNLLQILAMQEKDIHLLRVTTTGISSGMMTTG